MIPHHQNDSPALFPPRVHVVPRPPQPGRIVRTLILLAVKIRYHTFLRRLWKRQHGLFHMFNVCIKIRPDSNLAEAQAIQFVATNTSIPVPKVYYGFAHKGSSYIVMSRIKGHEVAHGWLDRSKESKAKILDQLRGMIAELRSVPVPEETGVESINGGPIYDGRAPYILYMGPFSTVRQFHDALIQPMRLDVDYNLHPDNEIDRAFIELANFYWYSGDELVLTHGDLSSHNILVQEDTVVGIVDWDMAGWFPPYWEYTSAMYVKPYDESWVNCIDQFLEPMPEELGMEHIRRRYFGIF